MEVNTIFNIILAFFVVLVTIFSVVIAIYTYYNNVSAKKNNETNLNHQKILEEQSYEIKHYKDIVYLNDKEIRDIVAKNKSLSVSVDQELNETDNIQDKHIDDVFNAKHSINGVNIGSSFIKSEADEMLIHGPSKLNIKNFENVNISSDTNIDGKLDGKEIKASKIHIGDKWTLSGVGDAHANDGWLRFFRTEGQDGENNYYGGVAAGNLWSGSNVYAMGNANIGQNLHVNSSAYFKGGGQGTKALKISGNWTGYPNKKKDGAEIANDTSHFKKLMIVGNKSAGAERRVGIWDRLDVNGHTDLHGALNVRGHIEANDIRRSGGDWLRIRGTPDKGTAMYNGVSINDGGGLSVGEWKKVPQGELHVTKGVNVTNDDPGALIEKQYGSNKANRYGLAQEPNGETHVYAAQAWTPSTVNLGFATGDRKYNKVLTVHKNKTTELHGDAKIKGNTNVGGDINMNNAKTIRANGRMNINPKEKLFLLAPNDVHVSKAWGGEGNLHVDGTLNIQGGTGKYNPNRYPTHFSHGSDGKNYIRGDTNLDGVLNVAEIQVPKGVKVTNHDPGAMIEKQYGTNKADRYGMAQENGETYLYAAQSHPPSTVNLGFATGDRKYNKVLTTYKDKTTEMHGTAKIMGDLCVGGICLSKADMKKLKEILKK